MADNYDSFTYNIFHYLAEVNGRLSSAMDTTARLIDRLRTAAEWAGRDVAELTVTVTPIEPLTPELVDRYARLGVHRLAAVLDENFDGTGAMLDAMRGSVERNAPGRLGAASR